MSPPPANSSNGRDWVNDCAAAAIRGKKITRVESSRVRCDRCGVTSGIWQALTWVEQGQRRLEDTVAALSPEAIAESSALPGWTRGHVITHVARNADALVNLLTRARTGTPTPMYATPDQRNADIEAGAGRALAEQFDDLRESGRRFAATAGRSPAGAARPGRRPVHHDRGPGEPHRRVARRPRRCGRAALRWRRP
ncbi:MAG: maleylpyruvate isomerase family mycothiol-dependent enzyme [Actinophytocola sp.]|nr:maleylpyruvate isomerase family mycothiol-dependent enzyme [Actinophytocola sp.]